MKYKLLTKRFEHPEGTIAYPYKYHTYGLLGDDQRETGVEHIALTLKEDGDIPFFTIPRSHVQKLED